LQISNSWNYNANEQILGLEIDDLTKDGRNEIIAYSNSGKIYILSSEGKILTSENITDKSPIWILKTSDIHKDLNAEMLIGALDGLLRVFRINKSLELKPLWAHQFGSSISGILYDDINQDGIIEVIGYSLDKTLRVISSNDGSLIWGQVFEDGIGDAIILNESTTKKSIIAVGNDGTIRKFDGYNGDLLSFLRFSDKMRCVSCFKSQDKVMIVCGGDDKKAHIIDNDLQKEVNTISFDDILWKIKPNQESLVLTTYSFDFLDESIEKNNIVYSSKILCLDENLNLKWELKNINTEIFTPYGKDIILGTTRGELMIIDGINGKVGYKLNTSSCINDIKCEMLSNRFYTCHDNGLISSYSLND
jgi:hypothetical protein